MDNIAQTLAGIAVAEAAFQGRVGRKAAWWTAIVTANLPDLEILTYPIMGRDHYMFWSRGVTHSLFAVALVPLVVAAVAARWSRRSWRSLYLLSALVYLIHIGSEACTSWGIMPLAPLDYSRVALQWVYMFDVLSWIILSTPLWFPRIASISRGSAARYSLGVWALYLLTTGVLHARAVSETESAAIESGMTSATVTAFPSAFLPLLWNGVVRSDSLLYQAPVRLFSATETALVPAFATNLNHPAVKAVAATPTGRIFLERFSRAPFAEVRCVGSIRWVLLSDLRFWSPWLNADGSWLVFEVTLNASDGLYSVGRHFWKTPWGGEALPDGRCALSPQDRRL